MNAGSSFGSTFAKFYLFVAGALCAVAGAWALMNLLDFLEVEDRIVRDTRGLASIRKMGPVLQGYVEAGITAEERKREQSRGQWFTFFDNIASVSGLRSDQYVLPSERKVKGRHYEETRFDIKVTRVDRRSIARFLWEVEKQRKYLKASEIKLSKPRKAGEFEDRWDGKVVVAYREKPAAPSR